MSSRRRNSNSSILGANWFDSLVLIEQQQRRRRMNDDMQQELVQVHDLITGSQSRSQERMHQIEEELVILTWHPSRLMNWCLDEESKEDIL